MLEWLLSKGADPAVICQTSTGRCVLHMVAAFGTRATLTTFIEPMRLMTKVGPKLG